MRLRLAAGVAAVAAVLSAAGLGAAAGGGDDGKALFTQKCGGCHTLGGGDTVGPDLKGVLERTSEDEVRAFITSPDEVLSSDDARVKALLAKFKGVKMPNLGLAPAEVDAIVGYLGGETAGDAGTETTPTTPEPAAGDAAAGEDLFTGETQFANGGAACISCHSLAGAGPLGGGQVGPDLTKAYDKYGGAKGVPAMLASLPFPTMQPVYDGHALTKAEAADLAAYLATTTDEPAPDDSTWLIVGIGLCVAVCLLALAFAIWPRRRLVVRRRIAPTSALTRRR
jgi:mono/diheme cytochrome c family protein